MAEVIDVRRDKRSFGALLRAAREQAGVTAATLARALDVSVPYICDVELGRRAPFAMHERFDPYVIVAMHVGGKPSDWRWRGTLERSKIDIKGLPRHVVALVQDIVAKAGEISEGEAMIAREQLKL